MKKPLFHLLRKSAKSVRILQNCTLFKSIKNKTQLICTDFADLRSSGNSSSWQLQTAYIEDFE
ncbi:hypothetical protein BpHYR1_049557 [Brachionus plicatilis]|uniref:Uncharacterized protein n=1 Tax=Brachionus plicatilis TaxID=10195 RepID=A0A3M7SAW9_BRAPC|nr:hypothetical protein BpHYR1_049557 [Brachionus plicatilis]